MKKINIALLLATLFFGALTYYFMYHADGGADGLSSFIPLVFFGVLCLCSFLAFLLSLMLRKGQSRTTRNWILGIALAIPFSGFLSVTGVFTYFTYDYQNQWDQQVESNKSVLSTLHFKNEEFGVSFNHVSGNVTTYENSTAISTPITPRIENEKLIMPVDDETYLEPDVLIKLENRDEVALSRFVKDLKKTLNLDLNFEKANSDDFPRLSKNCEVLMLTEENPYQIREKIGKYFWPKKAGQSDLIYFFNQPEKPNTIWVLIVSGKAFSAPASVEKMSSSNYESQNLWFHSLELLY